MSDRELKYLADFTALMATRKYGKVPSGHLNGSQLGVRFDYWVLHPKVSSQLTKFIMATIIN